MVLDFAGRLLQSPNRILRRSRCPSRKQRNPFSSANFGDYPFSPGVLAGTGTAWTRRLNIPCCIAILRVNHGRIEPRGCV